VLRARREDRSLTSAWQQMSGFPNQGALRMSCPVWSNCKTAVSQNTRGSQARHRNRELCRRIPPGRRCRVNSNGNRWPGFSRDTPE
jgi:hypothetical protein